VSSKLRVVGLRFHRRSLALGCVFLGFNEIEIELFDEIENSLRIAVVHSLLQRAGLTLEGPDASALHSYCQFHITSYLHKALIALGS
jgi:hypothetical protein